MSKRYLIRRLLLVVPVLLGTILIVFALVFLTPGDPVARLAGNKPLAPSTYNEIRTQYHLGQPFVVQYLYYLDGLVHGDLGATFTGRDVSSIISERFPVTLKLTLGAFAIEVVFGLLLAVVAAVKRRTFLDSAILVFTLFMITVPILVLGFVLQYVFGVKLHWLPVAGIRDGAASYVLPSLTLGLGLAASLGRLARSNVLDNMQGEHIRAAIARGLPRRRVVGRHVLKNSLVPIVTILGLDFAYLMGGAVITETIFNLPGLGNALITGIKTQNGPMVVGLVTLSAIIFVFTNLFVDLLCARIDPRISYE
ncbi:MAG TPA: ABC transporter permease [Actinomycetota bacterium]|nr:ABC transporter permease [Actinomycetota bacterium]